jgi:hypothetical protein
MVSHCDRYLHYTTGHNKVKLLSPGLGQENSQRLRVAALSLAARYSGVLC